MQTPDFFSRARRTLVLRGVIGKRATALLDEWHDHLECEIENLTASGQPRDESYRQACKALGEPEVLADRAAKQLARATWRGRHPFVSSSMIGLLMVFVSLLGMNLGGTVLIETKVWEHLRPAAVQDLVACIGSLPWVLGLAWLAWQARKLPAGWRGFWITAAFAGLILNLPKFYFYPPYNGPLTGTLGFSFGFDPIRDGLKLFVTLCLAWLIWWRVTRARGIRANG
ncbi:MAG: hypothetical protein ACR2RV_04180 [Verrucomicrobiales bacterium]